MFLHWHLELFYFSAQFLPKKSVPTTLFYHIFTISDGLFDPIWQKFITNIKKESEDEKDSRQHLLV